MRKISLALVIGLLLALPLVVLGCGKSEEDAVRDSVKGFAAAYNEDNFDKCAEYLQGVDDSNREEALSTLGLAKAVVPKIEVISMENVEVEGSTATAEVTARATTAIMLGGNPVEETVTMTLNKTDGRWKFDFNTLAQELMARLNSMAS